jgi:predicted PurR-regulated permease PerM
MTGFMGFVFSIYILLGKERLSKQFGRFFRTYLRAGWIDKIKPVVSVANNSFHFFIVGQVTEGIIIGFLCALGMWILRLPYAAMIGTVVGVTALIPILGCYLGAGIGALMCLSVGLGTAIEFLIFIFCLQQFEDNLIYPRVVGTSIGLPAIWVLASVTVGGGIGGFAGMILAVPVFATIYQLVRMDVGRREKKAGKPALADDAARQEALDE